MACSGEMACAPRAGALQKSVRSSLRDCCRAASLSLSLLVAACAKGPSEGQATGVPADGGVEMPSDVTGDLDAGVESPAAEAGPMPVRHLTSREYRASVEDLVGDTSLAEDDVPSEATSPTFDAFPFRRAGSVGTVEAGALQLAAEQVARNVAADIDRILPCAATNATEEDGCAVEFIQAFGKRAYRRPLDGGEASRLEALYRVGRTTLALEFEAAIALLVEAILQSPGFYYVGPHENELAANEGAVAALDPYTLASRMSYFLWGAPPDDVLFDAAEAGDLAAEAAVEAQARRMLEHTRARDMVADFVDDWLDLDTLPARPKDLQVYATYQEYSVAEALREETRRFAERVVFDGTGTFGELMTSTETAVNQPLAGLYGVSGSSGDDFMAATLDSAERGGLLTLGAFLANTGAPAGSAPARRGKVVATRFLCAELPDPPQLAPVAESNEALTTRERFEQHAQDPCATTCHSVIDPLGFAFEHYDGVGGYRETEQDLPVDASGSFALDAGDEVRFGDATELTSLLAESQTAAVCFTRQWFRYALGRGETQGDSSSLQDVIAAFDESGGDVRELIVALTKSTTFRYHAREEEVQP